MISGTWTPVSSLTEKAQKENEIRLLLREEARLVSGALDLLPSHFRRLSYIRGRLNSLGIGRIHSEALIKETMMIQLVKPEEDSAIDLETMPARTKKRKVSAILKANKDKDENLIAEICDVATGDVVLWTPQAWSKLLDDLEKCPDTLEEFILKNQPDGPTD